MCPGDPPGLDSILTAHVHAVQSPRGPRASPSTGQGTECAERTTLCPPGPAPAGEQAAVLRRTQAGAERPVPLPGLMPAWPHQHSHSASLDLGFLVLKMSEELGVH